MHCGSRVVGFASKLRRQHITVSTAHPYSRPTVQFNPYQDCNKCASLPEHCVSVFFVCFTSCIKCKFQLMPSNKGNVGINVTMRRVGVTIVAVQKYWALRILSVGLWPWVCSPQSACAVLFLSTVPCPVVPYFSTISHKRHDHQKKSYWTSNVCFDFLYNRSHSKTNWARYHKHILVFM